MRKFNHQTYTWKTISWEAGHRRSAVSPKALRRSASSVLTRIFCAALAAASAVFCGMSLQKEGAAGHLLLADKAQAAGSNVVLATPMPDVQPTEDAVLEEVVESGKRADRAEVAGTEAPGETPAPTTGDEVLDPEQWDDAHIDHELDNPDYEGTDGGIQFEQIGLLPGTKSEDVLELQKRLMALGFMDNDEPTTYYGSITKYSVQLFQRQHGLKVDGVAGEETLNLLYSDKAQSYYVTVGASGQDVYSIQERLKELNYNAKVTGYYGSLTKSAVKAFQARNGLSQTGTVNMKTRNKLFSSSAKAAIVIKPKPTYNAGSVVVTNVSAAKYIQYAQTLLGKRYVRGGKGPDVFDCSGFVYYCLNQVGVKQSYMTSYGWANTTKYAKISSMSSILPGDILCFNGHVGIYLGNGFMIDASATAGKIRITGNILTSSYWKGEWICARRVFG